MEVTATAKNIRISPQKVRLVVAQIKKMKPEEAIQILEFLPQKSALLLRKVILSAIANAKNNLDIAEESLKFSEIQVGKGPMSKRYRPVARGRAHSILKRTANIRVVLQGEKKVAKEPVGEIKNLSESNKVTKPEKEKKNGTKS